MTRLIRYYSWLMVIMMVWSLVPHLAAAASGSAVAAADTPSVPAPLTVPPVQAAQRPSLALDLAVAPERLTVGAIATATMTVLNSAPAAASDVALTLAVPAGAAPVGKANLSADGRSWQWTLKRLDGRNSATLSVAFKVTALPAGRAIVFQPSVTASELSLPIQAVGGALVEPAESQATADFTGKATSLRAAQHQVEVAIPAGLRQGSLRLSYATVSDKQKRDPRFKAPAALAGGRRGFGAFVLEATDATGKAVHQFDQPVTIKVGYTPEQLQALGISEADLAIFWFNEQTQQWEAQATSVDQADHTASIRVAHFSAYQLSDGSSPSAAFIPSLQGWQVGLFNGGVSYGMPIDLPAGPAGVRPGLTLSYNSASADGKSGLRPKQQAGWVGQGWSLDTGSVAANKINVSSSTIINYYTMVLNGQSFDLVRGEAVVASPSETDPSDWAWRPVDETFMKVQVVENGDSTGSRGGFRSGTPYKRYTWQVWAKDGTRYDFSEDLWWGFNTCLGGSGDYAYMETYKWNLSRSVDVNGNTVTYSYGRDATTRPETCFHIQGTVDRSAWPTQVTWGSNAVTGAPDRYKAEFVSSPRANDTQFDGADNQYGGINGQPREERQLDAVKVWSMQAAAWELVRQYNFGYDYSLLSDNTVNSGGTYTGNAAYPKLTLKSVQRVGKDGTSALPAMTFAYGTTRGTGQFPNGNWNRLTTVNNGQGGTTSFNYENIGAVTGNSWLLNYRRVTSKTVTDGRGHSYPSTYAYSNPALNSLGSNLDPVSGATQANANSAALYYNKYRYVLQNNSGWLAHDAYSEFRGHSLVVETNPDGNQTEHYFYQGDAACTPTATGGALDNPTDACYLEVRERELLKGKEYRTVVKQGAGTVLQELLHSFDFGFIDVTATPLSGLWRSFGYESETQATFWGSGPTPLVKRTAYFYDPASQGGAQYGNLTRVDEYDANNALYRRTESIYGINTASAYIVDRKIQETVRDGNTYLLSLAVFMYDGATTSLAIGTRGLSTLARRYYDIPANLVSTAGITLHSNDVSYGYDAYGNQTTVTTYAAAGTRLYNGSTTTFSAPGNGSAATSTTIAYDSVFHAFSVQTVSPANAQGASLVEQAGYDYRMGAMTSVTDPNSQATAAEYDVFGRMVKLIKPGDTSAVPTILSVYADNELPFRYTVAIRETAGAGNQPISQFYDGMGRKIQTKSESINGAQNAVTDVIYDGIGRAVSETEPRFVNESPAAFWTYVALPSSGILSTTNTFDALGRPLKTITPDGAQTRHIYDIGTGLFHEDVIDPNRHRIQKRSDVFGRLMQLVELKGSCGSWEYGCAAGETAWAADATTTHAYSPLDLLTSTTDTQGNVTTLGYDSMGRKISMQDPDLGLWSFAYDINNNLLSQTDARSQTISFGYDALGRVTSKILPNGGGTVAYTYDQNDAAKHANGKGQRTSMTDPSGSHHWGYSARGELARDEQVIGSTPYVTGYAYRSDGQPATMTYPTGEVLTYGYDAAGKLTTIGTSLGGSYLAGRTYDAAGKTLTQTYGNGVVTTSTYDAVSQRLTGITASSAAGTALQRAYTYDLAGNIKTITDGLAGETMRYAYDDFDRLTSACVVPTAGSSVCSGGATFNQSYAYDKIGNLTSKAGTAYTYPTNHVRPHAASTIGGQAYSYDNNGNLTSGGGRTYTWNAENQPTQIVKGTTTETYVYDGDNNRVKKITVDTNGGASEMSTSVYVGGIVEYKDKGKIVSSYGVAFRTTTGNPSGTNLGALSYVHSDHLGSVSATTSGTGAVQATQAFDPWGALRSGGIAATDFNYTGQRLDAGTGLLFYNARYYDPATARFVSADTIAPHPLNPQSRNRYSYTLNNPLRYTDPSGHCAEGSGDEQACANAAAEIGEYGIDVTGIGNWTLTELQLVLRAIWDMMSAAGWSAADFRNAITANGTISVSMQRERYHNLVVDDQNRIAGEINGMTEFTGNHQTITLFDGAFEDLNLNTGAVKRNDPHAKMVTVHELAHAWDNASGGRMSRGMEKDTGGKTTCNSAGECSYTPGDPGSLASDYAGTSREEDWAEAVAATVYPTYKDYNYLGPMTGRRMPSNSKRAKYVRMQMTAYDKPDKNRPN